MLFFRFLKKIFSTRRPFRLTRAGWIFILYTIGVGAGAINTGNNLLYLLFGLFLGILLSSGFLSDWSLWQVSVECKLPHAVQAGELITIPVTLTNTKKWLPSPALTIELQGTLRGERITANSFVSVILPLETIPRQIHLTLPNRGWFGLESLRLFTRFPFGLLVKRWTVYQREKTNDEGSSFPTQLNFSRGFIVVPQRIPIEKDVLTPVSSGEELSHSLTQTGEGNTAVSLKEYRDGDNPKHIDWKRSAKRGWLKEVESKGWLIRELESDQKNKILFCWPSLMDFKSIKPAEAENLVLFSYSLFRAVLESGTRAKLVIPKESDQGSAPSQPVWEIQGRDEKEKDQNTGEFLSLFNSSNPRSPLTQSYLQSSEHSLGAAHDLREIFDRWRKKKDG